MKKWMIRLIWWVGIILCVALAGAAIRMNFTEGENFGKTFWNMLLVCVQVAACIFLLYVPFITLIQKWWKKKRTKASSQTWWHTQTAKALEKFVMNGNAMFGALTIVYAFLLSILAHVVAPDKSPNANDQVNEIAYRPPGFSILMLKQPLVLKAKETGFFNRLINGEKSSYQWVPLNAYRFENDSLYIERYFGEGIQGQKMGFSLEDITGEHLSVDQNRKKIEDTYITNRHFILGTDDLGRDYFSRIILGIRVSLSVGFVAVIIALFIGIPIGALAGFYKRYPPVIRMRRKKFSIRIPLDDMIMWFINVIWAIPTLLLVFPIVFAFGQNYYTIFIAVGLTMWVDIARIVRGQVMLVRELEFVQAAKTFAFPDMRTIFRHILPNIAGPVIVITAANFAYAILTEAGLSFLGIGVQPPAPSWGLMISKYKDNLITNPYLPLIPGFAITLLVLAFFSVGNGLRDALDVKTKIEH